MESLSIPRTREFLEALIKEISGQIGSIKFVLKEGLAVVAAGGTARRCPTRQEAGDRRRRSRTIRSSAKRWKFLKAKSKP